MTGTSARAGTPPPVLRLGTSVLLSGRAVHDAAGLIRLALRNLGSLDSIPATRRWRHLLLELDAAASDLSTPAPEVAEVAEVPELADLPSSEPKVLINTEEAARMLDITGRQVRNLVGVLGARRDGRALVFDRALVVAEAARRHLKATA